VGDGNRVDVAAVHAVGAPVVVEVLAGARLGPEVYAVETAARRPDGPQIALKPHYAACVEGKHPARCALADRPPALLRGSGLVPNIG
jgi:hypothetical protein